MLRPSLPARPADDRLRVERKSSNLRVLLHHHRIPAVPLHRKLRAVNQIAFVGAQHAAPQLARAPSG